MNHDTDLNIATVAFASRLGGSVPTHFRYTPCVVMSSSTGVRRRPFAGAVNRIEQGLDPINIMRGPSANKRIPTGAWNTILSPAEAAARPYSEDL